MFLIPTDLILSKILDLFFIAAAVEVQGRRIDNRL